MTEILAAFLIAFTISMVLFPSVISGFRRMKAGQIVSTDGPQAHLSKQGTPTMGGILIVLVSSLSALLVGIGAQYLRADYLMGMPGFGTGAIVRFLVPLILLFLAFSGLGFLDDYLIVKRGKALGLRAREKLIGQFLIAVAFVAWLAYAQPLGFLTTNILPSSASPGINLSYMYYVLAVLYIMGFSNAVNIADGVDGLVGGQSIIAVLALWAGGTLAVVGTDSLPVTAPVMWSGLSLLCFAIAGACAAFLWFNANPAKIFMGDTGSLALGAVFAGIAILTKQEVALLIYGLVFIAEIGSIVIQSAYFKYTRRKYGEGRRIFKMSPIHHHYELSGWPEQLVVSRFWIVSAVCAAVGLLGRGVGIW